MEHVNLVDVQPCLKDSVGNVGVRRRL